MADPRAAAMQLFAAALGEDLPAAAAGAPVPWGGAYMDTETGLATSVEAQPNGQVALHFSGGPELLAPAPDGSHAAGGVSLRPDGARLRMIRAGDNLDTLLEPIAGPPTKPIQGVWRSAEWGAALTVSLMGGVPYAAASGELGEGAMVPLIHHGGDVWRMPCPRALDFSAPGDWTLDFRGGGLRVGCWLARSIAYERA
jgi:D-aminopeptidase